MQPVALIDMDGTICDFDLAMQRDLESLRAPCEEAREIGYGKDHPPYIWNRMLLIKGRGEWWENLPRIDKGFAVLEIMRELGYYISVLTQGPRDNAEAWSHKILWCKKNLPGTDVTITRNKGLVYGRVLMDDYPEYIMQWLEHRPRGLVIMPDQPWNQDFSHPNVLRHTDNIDEVREMLIKARDRADKEPLEV